MPNWKKTGEEKSSLKSASSWGYQNKIISQLFGDTIFIFKHQVTPNIKKLLLKLTVYVRDQVKEIIPIKL